MGLREYLPFFTYYFVFLLSRGLLLPVFPFYFDSLGLSIVEIGVIFAIFGASLLVFEVLWGVVVDRVGQRWSLPVITILASATYLLFVESRTFSGLLVLQVVLGISLSGVAVLARLQIAGVAAPHERGRAFGFLGSVFALAYVVGSPLGGESVQLIGYDNTFFVASLLALASFVPLAWERRAQRSTRAGRWETADETGSAARAHGPTVYRSELFMLGVIAVAIFVGWGFFTSLMPLVIAESPTISASVLDGGIMLAVFNSTSVVLQPLLGSVGSRRPRLWILAGLLVNGMVFLLLTRATNIYSIDLLTFVEGACFSTISPVSLSILTGGVSSGYLGRAMGLYGAAEDVGIIAGPFIGSILWAGLGVDAAYLGLGSILFVVLVAYFALVKGGRLPV